MDFSIFEDDVERLLNSEVSGMENSIIDLQGNRQLIQLMSWSINSIMGRGGILNFRDEKLNYCGIFKYCTMYSQSK